MLYSTLAKACESADMAGSEPYTWNGCELMRGNVGWSKGFLVHTNGMTIMGKSEICSWHGHPALIKGRWWPPMVRGYEIPFYWLGLCWTTVENTCITLSAPGVLFLSKDCSPHSGRVTLCAITLTLVCSLSLLQPLHSTSTVLGFKWRNRGLTPVFCTWQHSSDYKRNMLLDH